MNNVYDVIAWGRVVVQDREFYLLSPKPYHSEMADGKVVHSVWQPEGTLKWEVADKDNWKFIGDSVDVLFTRSIIVFGSDALLEFYQDPQTIKVKYVTPDEQDDETNL